MRYKIQLTNTDKETKTNIFRNSLTNKISIVDNSNPLQVSEQYRQYLHISILDTKYTFNMTEDKVDTTLFVDNFKYNDTYYNNKLNKLFRYLDNGIMYVGNNIKVVSSTNIKTNLPTIDLNSIKDCLLHSGFKSSFVEINYVDENNIMFFKCI